MSDGAGLYVEVRPLPSKKKVWRYKYPHPVTGQDVRLTLDDYPALTLVAARAKRREFEAMRANGLDPREQIELTQAKKENAHSLEKVARAWHAESTAKGQWGSDTSQKTMRKLENHLFPLIGHMSIEDVEPKHIAKALTAIDNKGINRVARDLKANFVRIFSYAIQNGFVRHNLAREMDGLIITRKRNTTHN